MRLRNVVQRANYTRYNLTGKGFYLPHGESMFPTRYNKRVIKVGNKTIKNKRQLLKELKGMDRQCQRLLDSLK